MSHLRLLLLTLLLSHLAAQGVANQISGDSSSPGPVTKGFYLGTTSSYFSGSTMGSRWGGNFGVYANYHLTELLGLQLDLSFLSKGAEIEHAADIRLDYVQFAVLARLDQPRSRYRDEYHFRPKLLGGFALDTRVKTRVRGLGEDYEHSFRDTELSLIFGGGFDHYIWGERAVSFEFRFDLGLSEVFADGKNNTAHFLVGMTL